MACEHSIATVICAAGSSLRMGGIKKEYRPLNNSTVLGTAVSAFAKNPLVKTIVIVIPENDEAAARNLLPPWILSAQQPQVFFVPGGETRRISVYNALSFLKSHNPRYVLIHDGARPWVSSCLIERTIDAVNKYNAVIPMIRFTDTPKECDSPFWESQPEAALPKAVFIKNHLKRANTGAAQTPQGFAFPEILHAHEKAFEIEQAGGEFTDDAEVWGKFCGPVVVIPGEEENRKITFPEDLACN